MNKHTAREAIRLLNEAERLAQESEKLWEQRSQLLNQVRQLLELRCSLDNVERVAKYELGAALINGELNE